MTVDHPRFGLVEVLAETNLFLQIVRFADPRPPGMPAGVIDTAQRKIPKTCQGKSAAWGVGAGIVASACLSIAYGEDSFVAGLRLFFWPHPTSGRIPKRAYTLIVGAKNGGEDEEDG
jgi:hypothetical protein